MKYTYAIFVAFLFCTVSFAQKPFTEGVITYRVKLKMADQQELTGAYVYTIKSMELKKELTLSNGYRDVTLINTSTGKVYNLQNKNGKSYAIELTTADLEKKQEKYMGYTVSNEQPNSTTIAGLQACKGRLAYREGPAVDVYYTKDWMPPHAIMYEYFPAAKFIVLAWDLKEGEVLYSMLAEKVDAAPVENAVFRLPADYKLISYKEYKELSQK